MFPSQFLEMEEDDQKAMNEEELFSTFVSELYDFHQGSRVNVVPAWSLFGGWRIGRGPVVLGF